MPTLIARLAMIGSFALYCFGLAIMWSSDLIGMPDILWDAFDLPSAAIQPPLWIILVGMVLSVLALLALGVAYWAIELILRGGRSQSFLLLAQRLRRAALGLIWFWVFYNLLDSGMPALLTSHLPEAQRAAVDWNPFDLEVLLLIVGIALFAIAETVKRAAEVEEENRLFL